MSLNLILSYRDVFDLPTRVQGAFCNIYQQIMNKNCAAYKQSPIPEWHIGLMSVMLSIVLHACMRLIPSPTKPCSHYPHRFCAIQIGLLFAHKTLVSVVFINKLRSQYNGTSRHPSIPGSCKQALTLLKWIYCHYFRDKNLT